MIKRTTDRIHKNDYKQTEQQQLLLTFDNTMEDKREYEQPPVGFFVNKRPTTTIIRINVENYVALFWMFNLFLFY